MTEFNNVKLKVLFTDDLQIPANIVSGENISTSFAKIHKMFNSMIEVTGQQNENLQYLMDYGCKNLIRISNEIKTETKRGITATYNQTEGTITLNGTHDGTGDAVFYLYSGNYADQPTIYPGTYYLDGVPSGGSPDTYVLILTSLGVYDMGDGKEFTLSSEGHIAPYIRIRKPSGADVSFDNTVFRPMLCSKSIYNLSSSFQPCPGYIIYSNDLPQMKSDIDTNIDDISSIKNVCSDLVDNKSKNKLLIQRNGLLKRNGVTASFDPISGTVTLNGSNGGLTTIFEMYTGNAVDQEVLPPGTYHMSGCAPGGSTSSYRCALIDVTGAVDTGSGCTFTLTSPHYIAYRILISGNQTFNNTVFRPMLCKQEAWELSNTFFPYCPSWNSVNADGIKNLVDSVDKNIFTTNTTTSTITDVTFTNNNDGTWTVSGTAADRRQKALAFTAPSTLQSGKYVLSGCPSGAVSGSTTLYCLYLWDTTTNVRISQNDTGSGTEFDWTPDSTHQYQIVVDIRSGTTASDLIFKPMICNQTYWTLSNTYVPYAPSNRELYLTKQDTLTSTQLAAANSGITEDIVTELTSKSQKVIFTSQNITNGGWIKASDGTLQSGNFNYTDYISLKGYSKIGVSCGVGQFAFYKADKSYDSGITIANTDTHDYVEYQIPQSAAFVRLTVGNTAPDKGFYTLSNGEQVFDPIVVSATKYEGQFRKLRDGISYAVEYKNSTVIVKQGTYDLVSEFASEIENVSTAKTEFGIVLRNNVHVIFSPQSLVTALYTGSNTDIPKYFAPFCVESGGDDTFELENLTIKSQNTRYCVHDELDGKSTFITRHIYRNCRMEHDSTSIALTGNNYVQCIGGGCGRQTYVEIDGCEFASKRGESSNTPLVSYHNAINASGETHDGKSAIYIRNSYFHDKGYARASYYGETTAVSKLVVSGCSFEIPPVVQYEVPGATTPENFELVAFNNEIRTT